MFSMPPGPLELPEHVQIIGGHDCFYPMHRDYNLRPPYRYFTIVRDPADWLLSAYHHDVARSKEIVDFWEWYENPSMDSIIGVNGNRNRLFKWYQQYNKNPYELLNNCWFVGITERTEEFYPWLFMQWGLPTEYKDELVTGEMGHGVGAEKQKIITENIFIPKRYELTEWDRKRIWEENPIDVRFYEYAKRLYENKVDNGSIS
jgi:hypothetical protein